MSKWTDSLEEKGSPEAEGRVFSAVGAILDKKVARKADSISEERGGWWRNWLVPSASMAAIGLVMALWFYPRGSLSPIEEMAAEEQGADFEIAMDFRVIRDLHELEKLEFLQKVGDPEEWHKKKKSPKKG